MFFILFFYRHFFYLNRFFFFSRHEIHSRRQQYARGRSGEFREDAHVGANHENAQILPEQTFG